MSPAPASSRRPGPRVLAVATVIAFGGAFAGMTLPPWGPYVAAALLAGWVALAAWTAREQQASEPPSPAVPEVRRPMAVRVIQLLLLLPAAIAYGYSEILARQGAAEAIIDGYRDGAMLLFPVGLLLNMSVDWTYDRWARRRRSGEG